MFEPSGPLNAERPASIPTKPQGRIPVIARLVWADRVDLVPARAIRWTSTHVLVLWTPDEHDVTHEQSVWIPATDVRRRIELPPDDASDHVPVLAGQRWGLVEREPELELRDVQRGG